MIRDLLEESLDAVTEIFTIAGKVRGNHIHAQTTQWVYVVRGELLVAERPPDEEQVNKRVFGAGDFFTERAGVAHAWKAYQDTTVLVFTRGPRSGQNYESDTQRLTVPLLE